MRIGRRSSHPPLDHPRHEQTASRATGLRCSGRPINTDAEGELVNGNEEVVELLNEVLTGELTAVNQYFVDAKMFTNWGYLRLGERFRSESIDEMKDAEALIERILYLKGHPNVQRLGTIRTGERSTEKLKLALELEHEAIERLNRGISRCSELGDAGTRDLLEGILEGEEDQADWLDTQLVLVNQLGEEHYLAQQVRD
jgi:bacterioferritin